MSSRKDLEHYLHSKGIHFLLKDILQNILIERPHDPISFMLQYLQGLQHDLQKQPYTSDPESEATATQDDEPPSQDEAQDGEQEDTFTQPPPPYNRRRRRAIQPTPMADSGPIPAGSPKSPETIRRINQALETNLLFESLDADQKKVLFDAMVDIRFQAGDKIITQGEEGDNFYVVQEGICEFYLDQPDGQPPLKVGECGPDGSFGEIALMYGCPRQASVLAQTDVLLWAITRGAFRSLLMAATKEKRERYQSLLSKVPILSELSEYERSKVIDALQTQTFADGAVIVRQCDPGHEFYIIADGEVVVSRSDEKNPEPLVVGQLRPPQFFGEIALLREDQRRQATITAVGPCTCLSLQRESFDRLLGPLEQILRRNMENYSRYF
eukprot:gnl/Trimastix_PCT/631.p1 GENE.gnl/Trimastix_PCT/631~~gnl/Trimastix_PCT/631.p1  ORF type:complete len:383 (+),score=119.34 gnl/Trimastix_PCT/631:47-1195(+)